MPATVLVVDNDRSLCQILAKALGAEGYRVLTEFDGDSALGSLVDEEPDVVLLDVMLPRRDGFAVLEALRGLDAPLCNTPVVLFSGCTPSPEYSRRAESLGAVALLTKPVPLDDLLSVVADQVGKLRADGAPRPTTRAWDAALEGSLAQLSFPALLHHLHGLRAEGVLHLVQGRKRKWIAFDEGYPVAVRSNLVGECLGNFLARTGRISTKDVEESRKRMTEGQRQGEILVAMQVLAEEEVAESLRVQAEEKLFEIFAWREGEFRFEKGGQLQRANELAVDGSPANLILRGVCERLPLETLDAFFARQSAASVAPCESPFYRFQEIELSEEQQELLRGLDGPRPLQEFAAVPEALRRTVFALIATGLLELVGGGEATGSDTADTAARCSPTRGATPARPAAQRSVSGDDSALRAELAALAARCRSAGDPFEMFQLDLQASDEEIQTAYAALAERVHPDRVSAASDAVKELAREVSERVVEAHKILADPRSRQQYLLDRQRAGRDAAEREESKRSLEAEMEFQKGAAALGVRRYPEAVECFRKAVEIAPDEGEYVAHHGWALHCASPDDPKVLERAIREVRRAIKLAGDRETSYLFMGRLCKASGRIEAAEKMFTRAVRLQSDCVEALRELRLINMRREKQKGFIRRLFRR